MKLSREVEALSDRFRMGLVRARVIYFPLGFTNEF